MDTEREGTPVAEGTLLSMFWPMRAQGIDLMVMVCERH